MVDRIDGPLPNYLRERGSKQDYGAVLAVQRRWGHNDVGVERVAISEFLSSHRAVGLLDPDGGPLRSSWAGEKRRVEAALRRGITSTRLLKSTPRSELNESSRRRREEE